MRKVKLIVHETYQGKRKSEDVFAAVQAQQPQITRSDIGVIITMLRRDSIMYPAVITILRSVGG